MIFPVFLIWTNKETGKTVPSTQGAVFSGQIGGEATDAHCSYHRAGKTFCSELVHPVAKSELLLFAATSTVRYP